MSQESLLNLLLRVNNNPVQRRELFEGLDSYAKGLRRNPLPVGDYKTFLKTVHDIYIRSESAVKSELLRIIRYGFVTPAHGDEIITEVGGPLYITYCYFDSNCILFSCATLQ